jgi:hypothetical protein
MFWIYRYTPSSHAKFCCGRITRGLAILGDTLYLASVDAHLIAIDAENGQPLWDTIVAPAASGYSMTLAPLVVNDKVIVGTAGGEFGIRGFIAAYDAHTGKQVWRFNTVPRPGEPGHETWGDGDGWMHGALPALSLRAAHADASHPHSPWPGRGSTASRVIRACGSRSCFTTRDILESLRWKAPKEKRMWSSVPASWAGSSVRNGQNSAAAILDITLGRAVS